MYADAFRGEYLASWTRDDSSNWTLSDYTNPEQHRFRLFRKSLWTETFFSDDIFLEENCNHDESGKHRGEQTALPTVRHRHMDTTLMVEGVSEC